MLETEESVSEIDSHHGVLAIWAHKHAGKHMVGVYNCCLQFFNSWIARMRKSEL